MADEFDVAASSTKFSTECISMDISASKLPCIDDFDSFLFGTSVSSSPLTISSTNFAAINKHENLD